MEFIRLDGRAGTKPGYLNGYIQTFAEVAGRVAPVDGEQVDCLDLNANLPNQNANAAVDTLGSPVAARAQGDHAIRTPLEIFISFSHIDERLQAKLEAHLSPLKHQGLIAAWHYRKIGAGTEWDGQINEHLNSAHIILLLITIDFITSRYCYDVEMKRALQRHEAGEARVIPIILRPCDWHLSPFAKLQALPKNAKLVTDWPNRDKAFTDVAKGIRTAVMELTI